MAAVELDFDAVYTEHGALVRRALTRRGIRPADLDDVLQETFVTVHKLLPAFEQRASVETWLHAVAWRVAADYHRRRRSQRLVTDDNLAQLSELSPEDLPGVERLHDSLQRVDPEDRDMLALHEVGGLSIAELSDLIGSSRATISERLDRTRRALGRIISIPPPSIADAATASSDPDYVSRLSLLDCEHADYCFSTLGNVVFAFWRGDSTEKNLEKFVEVTLTAASLAPAGVVMLTYIEPTSRPPNRKGRQMMRDLAAEVRGDLRAAACAVGSQGFGYLVAPIVNSALFLARNPLNIRFFHELPEATAWLAPHTDGRTQEELLRYAAGVIARLDRCSKPPPR